MIGDYVPLAEVGFVEPWWVQILKAIVILVVVLQIAPLMVLLERKWLGRFQSRYGPNRVGYKGSLQPLADVFKLLSKEQFHTTSGVAWMMALAPAISVFTAIATVAIIPFGNVAKDEVGWIWTPEGS